MSSTMWRPTTDKKYGVAIYNFLSKVHDSLPLEIGETVQILEELIPGSWYRGFSTRNKHKKGIFPATYVHIIQCKVDPDGLLETVTPIENPFVTEVTYVLREWSHIWKQNYKISDPLQRSLFNSIRQVMIELMDYRCRLKAGTCTQEQARDVEKKIATKIDWGNKRLGLDLVPRIDGTIVDPDKISPVELYGLHVASTKQSESGSTRRQGSVSLKPMSKRILTHHLYLSLKSFGVSCGEDMEVFFSLFDNKEGKFISERVVFKLPKGDLPANPLKNALNVLYTDLGNSDLSRDLYLVAHIYRIGRMLPSESTKRAHASSYRRPWGCAVQGLRDLTLISFGDSDSEKDFTMRITSIDEKAEKEFSVLHENLIKKQSSKASVVASNMLISVLVLHGELQQVKRANPLLLRNVPIALKQGFSDIILPGDVRNDLYLLLNRGELSEKCGVSTNVTNKNVEVTILVLDGQGHVSENCIFGAVGEPPTSEYKSSVFRHSNGPRWNETIKITLPTEQYEGCHLRFEFRHCSTKDKGVEKKLFAFSFLKLMKNDGIIIKDGPHELYCYKTDSSHASSFCEDVSKLKQEFYVNLPCSSEDINPSTGTTGGNTFFSRCTRDSLTVETRLCSTKLTQNVDLLGLLKWRQHPDRIKEYLDKVEGLGGDEIVKMLQDILDALFSIFSELPNHGDEAHGKAAFHTLVHILNLLQEQKYEHFKPVLDTYVKESFSSALAYRDIIRCLIMTIENLYSGIPDRNEEAERVFKSLTFLFKFIVQSRILYQRASGSHSTDEEFRKELFTLFNCMYSMLPRAEGIPIIVQNVFLENIIQVHETLLPLFSVDEVADFMSTLISRVPRDTPAKVVETKLGCIQKLVNTDLFVEADARDKLIKLCMSQVKQHFIRKPPVEVHIGLCAAIVRDVLIVIKRQSQAEEVIYDDVAHVVSSNMEVIIRTVQRLAVKMSKQSSSKQDDIAGSLVSCLIGLLKIMEESHYREYLSSYPGKVPLKDFLVGILSVFRLLVQKHVFPKDWIVMRLETDNTILTAMRYFSECLCQEFLDSTNFNQELWTLYFQVAVNFVTQHSLQLEVYSEAKKDKIMDKYGDMRVRMGFEIISMWQVLGEHKIKFIPHLVGPFLQVTLVAEAELRRAMLPLFVDMMECEHNIHSSFKMVETELIDKLDIEVSQNKGDEEYKNLFNTILLEKVQKEPSWQKNGTQFIKSVTSLLERLLDYRNVMDGEENRGKKMTCTYNLLNFYKNEFNREEMYIRYIYKLCDLHLAARNFTEAGFTLKLHADMLDWGDAMMHAEGTYPAQREWERKRQLYELIIGYFDQGKSWEYGIPLCKELAWLYEKKFDYAKLSSILQTQATFFQNILTQLRQGSSYYRVGFYGKKFPLFLRNKLFVYRGDEYEKLGSFRHRMQSEFPNAELLSTLDPPDDETKNKDIQCIQICEVRPIPSDKEEFKGQVVPEEILSFYSRNDVTLFESRRPFHRGVKNKDSEFKTLCLEITQDELTNQLPGILRWFEVKHSHTSTLSPVETAIDTVKSMNKVLKTMVKSYGKDRTQTLHPFTMKLNGVVDAAVNGGITKYKEAFFSEEFAFEQPGEEHNIQNLRQAFGEQIEILKGALELHGQLVPPEMQPLHINMVSMFANMEKSIAEDVPKVDSRSISGFSQMSHLLDRSNCDSAYESGRQSVSSSHSVGYSSNHTPRLPTPSENNSTDAIPENYSNSGLFLDDEDIYEAPPEVLERCPTTNRSLSMCVDEPPLVLPKLPRRPATTNFTGILERQEKETVGAKEKVRRTVSDNCSVRSHTLHPRLHVAHSSSDIQKAPEVPPEMPPPLPDRPKRQIKLPSDPFPSSFPNKPKPRCRQTIHASSNKPTVSPKRKLSVTGPQSSEELPPLPQRPSSPTGHNDDPDGRSSAAPPLPARGSPILRKPSLPVSPVKRSSPLASLRKQSVGNDSTSQTPPPLPPNKPQKAAKQEDRPPPLPPRPSGSARSPPYASTQSVDEPEDASFS